MVMLPHEAIAHAQALLDKAEADQLDLNVDENWSESLKAAAEVMAEAAAMKAERAERSLSRLPGSQRSDHQWISYLLGAGEKKAVGPEEMARRRCPGGGIQQEVLHLWKQTRNTQRAPSPVPLTVRRAGCLPALRRLPMPKYRILRG